MNPEPAPERRDVTMSVGLANLLAAPLFVGLVAVYGYAFHLVWGDMVLVRVFLTRTTLIALVAGIFLHELLHGIGWKFAGKIAWEDIKFGVHWKLITPYAHCKVPITARAYRVGVVLPALFLGFLPATVGLITGDAWFTILGALFLGAAGGDLLGLWVLRSVPADAKVLDHPTKLGCEVIAGPLEQT